MLIKKLCDLIQGKVKIKPKYLHNFLYGTKEYKWKQRIMWLGVIVLASTVLFMWFLATNATFFDINKNLQKSKEIQMLNENTKKVKEILTGTDIKIN